MSIVSTSVAEMIQDELNDKLAAIQAATGAPNTYKVVGSSIPGVHEYALFEMSTSGVSSTCLAVRNEITDIANVVNGFLLAYYNMGN